VVTFPLLRKRRSSVIVLDKRHQLCSISYNKNFREAAMDPYQVIAEGGEALIAGIKGTVY
jgi:hypothetical protein